MLAKFPEFHAAWAGALLVLLVVAGPRQVSAQLFNDPFSQNEFFESDEDGFDDEGGFGLPSPVEDFTEGGQFIDEDAASVGRGGVTIRGRETELRLEGEQRLLPLNVSWGAGTGLLIGGWFALIENGDDRSTQRSIGLGVVLGALLGVTVGLKTLIAPDAPRAALLKRTPEPLPPAGGSLAALQPLPPLSFGFALRF